LDALTWIIITFHDNVHCANCEVTASSSLWKYDACPIYIAMMTMLDEIYNNAH